MRERFSYNIKRMCFYMDEEGNGRKLYNFTTVLCLYKLFARFLRVINYSIMDRLQQFLCIGGILNHCFRVSLGKFSVYSTPFLK